MKLGRGLAAAAAALTLGTAFAVAGPPDAAQAASLACAQISGNPAGACIDDQGSRYMIRVWDNSCDGHRAYAQYRFGITGTRTFRPATQCGGRYTKYDTSIAGADGRIRVCINDAGTDTCSRWVSW
jgi:hypothetical protein